MDGNRRWKSVFPLRSSVHFSSVFYFVLHQNDQILWNIQIVFCIILFFLAVTLYFFVCFFSTNRCIILKHCELGILPGKNEMTRRTLQRGQHLSLMETEESLGDIIASPLRGGDGGGVVIRISCLFHRSILSHWQTCCFNDMMQTT